MTKIHIPNSVLEIGISAFEECTSMEQITIPNSVRDIGTDAFAGCIELREINIPDSVNFVGYNILKGCSSSLKIMCSKNSKVYKEISKYGYEMVN